MKFLRQLPKEKMQKLVLTGIFTLIGVSAMAVFWIGEERGKVAKNEEKIAKLEPQILDRERKDRAEMLNEPLRQQLATFVQTQQLTMLTGDFFSWLVREVMLFAERYPVQMVSIRPGQKQSHPVVGSYEIYNAHVEVRGTYDDLGRFVCGLENSFPTAQIRGLDVTPGEGDAGLVRGATIEIGLGIWPENATAWVTPKSHEEPRKKQ